MQTIEVYKTPDGKLFEDDIAAKRHEEDLIGEEIDNLLRLVLKLDVNRRQLVAGFSAAMFDRKELIKSINALHYYLNFDNCD